MDEYYRSSHSGPNKRFVEVPMALVAPIKCMAKSLAVHVDRSSSLPNRPHFARSASLHAHAVGAISSDTLHQDLRIHRRANSAKHCPPVSGLLSDPSPFRARWADFDLDHVPPENPAKDHLDTKDQEMPMRKTPSSSVDFDLDHVPTVNPSEDFDLDHVPTDNLAKGHLDTKHQDMPMRMTPSASEDQDFSVLQASLTPVDHSVTPDYKMIANGIQLLETRLVNIESTISSLACLLDKAADTLDDRILPRQTLLLDELLLDDNLTIPPHIPSIDSTKLMNKCFDEVAVFSDDVNDDVNEFQTDFDLHRVLVRRDVNLRHVA